MPTTTGDHQLTYPSEGATGWYATWESFAQAISNHLDNLADVQIDTIEDASNNELLKFTQTASAVNFVNITNAATTGGPTIAALGDDTNIDLNINPKGSGQVVLDSLKWPAADGSADQLLKTDGSGNLSFTTVTPGIASVVADTTPQLGGDLDLNGNGLDDANGNEMVVFNVAASAINHLQIANAAAGAGPTLSAVGDGTNIDMTLTPKGSGNLILDGLTWPNADGTASQVLQTDGAGTLSFATSSGGEVARAYIEFDGTGTPSIATDYNIDSITDHGTGDYTINFDGSTFTSADYVVTGFGRDVASSTIIITGDTADTRSTSAYRINTYSNSTTKNDSAETHLVFFGGQN